MGSGSPSSSTLLVACSAGFQSDRCWWESATAEDIQRREVEYKARSAAALKKFSLWKDVKVKNFTGRSRVEVWGSSDIADFSDLMDDESEGERPAKRRPTKRACQT
jgi:hypothetical protein